MSRVAYCIEAATRSPTIPPIGGYACSSDALTHIPLPIVYLFLCSDYNVTSVASYKSSGLVDVGIMNVVYNLQQTGKETPCSIA